MAQRVLIVTGIIFAVFQADAQSNDHQKGWTPSPDAVSSFQPSLAVVIGILCVMFFVTFILLIYAKCCHRGSSVGSTLANGPRLVRSASRFSGIDKTVIESLPFFRFSSLKGSRDGLECSVCLSKFEDVEILRLLPKCKHAFHINCVDAWLENHSSCPLCRCKVNPDDPTIFTYSNSMRFMFNQSEPTEDSNVELFVQREESHRGSSRFSVGSSFRKILKQPDPEDQHQEETKSLHKFNHKIMVSDVVFKNRWSNVSSSDLMLLESEMLNGMSNDRFTSTDTKAPPSSSETSNRLVGPSHPASILTSPGDRRAISEITSFSRYEHLGFHNDDLSSSNVKNERARRVWIPIARRTVQWFANREKRSQQVGV